MKPVLKPRRGTSKIVSKKNFILEKGEMFFELMSQYDSISEAIQNGDNRFRIKIGDGISSYNNLPYVGDRNDKPLTFKIKSCSNGILYDVVMGG